MRWYRGPKGDERIWFEPDEIEALTEGELRKAGLFPTFAEPAVNVERFVEAHLRVDLDQHAELHSAVLGVTEFRVGLPPRILINRDLTGSALDRDDPAPGQRGRWRATVAHEGTHVLFHEVLFDLDERQGTLLEDADHGGRLMRCLKREVSFANSSGDWREVQANRGMAALLMPRPIFGELARTQFARLGLEPGTVTAESREGREVVTALASLFDVSRTAASIRLGTLGFFLRGKASPLSAKGL